MFERKASRDAMGQALDAMKKGGMTVSDLPAAEQAKLRDKMKPVIDKNGAAIADTVKKVQAELTRIRKS